MSILNLTQHPASPKQVKAGVIDLIGAEREQLIAALTLEAFPSPLMVWERALEIAALAAKWRAGREGVPLYYRRAMIGGAPCLMAPLERALKEHHIEARYAFSLRESVEETRTDGSVEKVSVFRHLGFVPGGIGEEEGPGSVFILSRVHRSAERSIVRHPISVHTTRAKAQRAAIMYIAKQGEEDKWGELVTLISPAQMDTEELERDMFLIIEEHALM